MIESNAWEGKNQRYLVSCIGQLKAVLRSFVEKGSGNADAPSTIHQVPLWDHTEFKPAIEYVCETFGLSSFERLVLLLCAAVELDSEVSVLCAKAQGNPSAEYPTFSLALAAFPRAHWSALTPASPLRRFRLINVQGLPQTGVTKCRLRIEEKVLHYIAGVSYLDESLQGGMEPVCMEAPISDSQKIVASSIIHAWKTGRNPFHIQLSGSDEASKMAIVSWACRQLGIMLWRIPWEIIPERREEQESIAQIWTRESVLMNAGLYIMLYDSEQAAQKVIRRFMNSVAGPVFLSTNERWKESDNSSSVLSFEVSKPTKIEQRDLWKMLLLEKSLAPTENNHATLVDKEIARVVNQFNMNRSSIQSAVSDAVLAISGGKTLREALWSCSLAASRPRLSELAQRIPTTASIDDLVLPEKDKRLLHNIVVSVKQRYHVYEEWGFGRSQRGLGIVALFSGDSGTGKTMAAEVIARELELDLFRIDLSVVVSKYIGETEKNLRRIFDAAEDGGSILLFDEADALFGKRSEIQSSHDRYANIEVGYLLQRMEAYSGLAILTTNMKESLDKAFLRRIRFVVKFPNPNHNSRKEIWKKAFPSSVPLDNNIDYDRLAQLDVAGGHIRNIALGASMMAAEEGAPVGMAQIANAAKDEYEKMERPMPLVRELE